jgi:hypothetical protein
LEHFPAPVFNGKLRAKNPAVSMPKQRSEVQLPANLEPVTDFLIQPQRFVAAATNRLILESELIHSRCHK